MDICIEVNGTSAAIVEDPDITSGVSGIVGIKFNFSAEWNGLVKTVILYCNNYDEDAAIEIVMGSDYIPPDDINQSIFQKKCDLYIGVFGDDGNGKRITSNVVGKRVIEGTPTEGVVKEVTPDALTQMVAIVNSANEKVEEANEKVVTNEGVLAEIEDTKNATIKAVTDEGDSKLAELEKAKTDGISAIDEEVESTLSDAKTSIHVEKGDAIVEMGKAKESDIKGINNAATLAKASMTPLVEQAQTSASNAQTSANNAQTSANNAQTSAQNIQASATQIAQNTSDIASANEDIVKLQEDKKWKYLGEYSIDADTDRIMINKDVNGNSFTANEVYAYFPTLNITYPNGNPFFGLVKAGKETWENLTYFSPNIFSTTYFSNISRMKCERYGALLIERLIAKNRLVYETIRQSNTDYGAYDTIWFIVTGSTTPPIGAGTKLRLWVR